MARAIDSCPVRRARQPLLAAAVRSQPAPRPHRGATGLVEPPPAPQEGRTLRAASLRLPGGPRLSSHRPSRDWVESAVTSVRLDLPLLSEPVPDLHLNTSRADTPPQPCHSRGRDKVWHGDFSHLHCAIDRCGSAHPVATRLHRAAGQDYIDAPNRLTSSGTILTAAPSGQPVAERILPKCVPTVNLSARPSVPSVDAVRPSPPARFATGLPGRFLDGVGMTDSLSGHGQLVLEARRLFTTFGFMAARQGATASIGLGYWIVTTHLFAPEAVGLSAAAASTAMLLVTLGALGVPLLFMAEIESIDPLDRRVAFTTGNAMAVFVVLILATGTVAVSPYLGTSLRLIGSDPVMATLFVIGSVATMAALTLDDAALGLHRGAAQLWQGAISSILKLAFVALLLLASVRTGEGLIFAWAVALVAAFFSCMPMLGLQGTPVERRTLGHRTELVRRYGALSLQHHVLQLAISSVSYIIPLIATLLISPSEVAYFSAAFLLSSVLLIVPYLLAISLFAERSGTQANSAATCDEHFRSDLPSSERSCWRWKSLRRWRSGSSALPTRQTERRHCAS